MISKKYVLIFLLFSFNTAFAQFGKQEKQFLTWFFKEKLHAKEPILYLPDQWPGSKKELIAQFQSDTLINIGRPVGPDETADQVILTSKERSYLNKQILKIVEIPHPNNVIPGASIISRDTVNFYQKQRLRGWVKLYAKKINGYYSFTKPIFLRGCTLCVFQYGYSCGELCGQGTTSVYRLVNGKWEEYLQLSCWIS